MCINGVDHCPCQLIFQLLAAGDQLAAGDLLALVLAFIFAVFWVVSHCSGVYDVNLDF